MAVLAFEDVKKMWDVSRQIMAVLAFEDLKKMWGCE